MQTNNEKIVRPLALVILDGWGYAPRTDRNALAIAHTPFYDGICRRFPMTLLSTNVERSDDAKDIGDAEVGHLRIGTGRTAQTEASQIKMAVESGTFMNNEMLNSAFQNAKMRDSSVHLIGMLSDGGTHSSIECLFALLRLAKQHDVRNVFVHCILDGVDVEQRTADVYIEALELKLSDIGTGKIATLCGRYFAMDSGEHWERTARAYTMLAHAEGERASDAASAIRNSFLRGISDEFVSPIVLESEAGKPVATLKNDDLVVFFNHRGDGIRQLVRSVSVPEGSINDKPIVNTVCMTEYDAAFELPVAFGREPEKNSLSAVLSESDIGIFKITETSRFHHLTHFFDGGDDTQRQYEQQILVHTAINGPRFGQPEAESFKITDKFQRALGSAPKGVFVVNIPAADIMAATGDVSRTVAAIQYVDTCLGGICEKMDEMDGIVVITSSHSGCEEMIVRSANGSGSRSISNPVPLHYVDTRAGKVKLKENGSLEDVAPTMLGVLGIEKPQEMTGTDLRIS